MRLENWSIGSTDDYYTAPENIRLKASGCVFGNEKFKDGYFINTSILEEINLQEKYVITHSGNKYFLGQPDPEWIYWLKETKDKYYNIITENFDAQI